MPNKKNRTVTYGKKYAKMRPEQGRDTTVSEEMSKSYRPKMGTVAYKKWKARRDKIRDKSNTGGRKDA